MIIIPGILNATQVTNLKNQFWIQDNILKFKGNKDLSRETLCDIRSNLQSDIGSIQERSINNFISEDKQYKIDNEKL